MRRSRNIAAAPRRSLDQLATIIYTSGTTGEPKGVMLTHANLSSNATDACPSGLPPGEIALSLLPLAHVYERTMDYVYLFEGMAIAYVEHMEDVARALLEVRPSMAAAVPRFFEKIYANIMERGQANKGFRRRGSIGPSQPRSAPFPGRPARAARPAPRLERGQRARL